MNPAVPRLEDSARRELLALARRTLESYMVEREIPLCIPNHSALKERAGAFVTLRRGTELRGCIGQVLPDAPLFLTVQRCAVSAALEDTRFAPVAAEELPEITIEISVLSQLERVRDPAAIEVGRHGLMVSRGGRRGLLLPQVAAEYGWDLETFLAQTCRKARLPPDAWRDSGTAIEAFAADFFSEESCRDPTH